MVFGARLNGSRAGPVLRNHVDPVPRDGCGTVDQETGPPAHDPCRRPQLYLPMISFMLAIGTYSCKSLSWRSRMRRFDIRLFRPRIDIMRHVAAGLVLALVLALVTGGPLAAQEEGVFDLELNNTEAVDGGCRLTFVARNGTGTALEQTSYDVAVFDDTGAV